MATEAENMSDNWKEKLHEIFDERKNAVIKKRENEKAAHEWRREILYPAFNKLVTELKRVGIETVSHDAGGISLDNTLKFEFGETSLRYSIKLLISSKNVMGKTSFTAMNLANPGKDDNFTEKEVPTIINAEEQEIIKDFLLALETWEVI